MNIFTGRWNAGGFFNSGQPARKVLEKIEPGWFSSFDEVILAGFYLLTAAEFELLNRVLESESTRLLSSKGPAGKTWWKESELIGQK